MENTLELFISSHIDYTIHAYHNSTEHRLPYVPIMKTQRAYTKSQNYMEKEIREAFSP